MARGQGEMRDEPSRCAIYTRQSIDTRSDFTSCQAQFEVCRNYLKSQQWLGWRWIEERFDDEGYSGATLDRPALRRLLEKVRRGEIDRVLVYSRDRLSRNVIDGLQLLQEFRQRGVALVVATYPELGSAAQDSLIINILSVSAEFERELIRSRIAEVRVALKRQGKRVGGAVPYGYDADPFTKQLMINEQMFTTAAESRRPSEIARIANERGWRTKVREGRRTGRVSGGNPWTARQVLATLSNPVYLGKFADGDGTREGVHEAIVSEELFEAARRQIESRRTRAPGREEHEERWHLKGLIRCAGCGRAMSSHTTRHGSRIYRYYRCRSHAGGRSPCPGVQVPAGEIEREIFRVLYDLPATAAVKSGDRDMLLRFSAAWSLLGSDARRELLHQVVKEIRWDAETGEISLSLDEETLKRYGRDENARGRRSVRKEAVGDHAKATNPRRRRSHK